MGVLVPRHTSCVCVPWRRANSDATSRGNCLAGPLQDEMRAPLLALLALCAAALLPGSLCDIVSDSLDHDARSIVLVARPFGFEANGMVDVKVSNWHVYLEAGKPKYDPNKIGFFITTAEAEVQLQQDLAAGASSLFWHSAGGSGASGPAHTPRATPHSCWPPSWLLPPLPRLLPGAWQRRHASRGALIGFDTWALPGLVPGSPPPCASPHSVCAPSCPGGCVLDSDNVEKLFTFAEMEAARKKNNNTFYEFPGRIPPDAVRAAGHGEANGNCSRAVSCRDEQGAVPVGASPGAADPFHTRCPVLTPRGTAGRGVQPVLRQLRVARGSVSGGDG
jgi:hypothetical protein